MVSQQEIAEKMAQVVARNRVRFLEDLTHRMPELEHLQAQLMHATERAAALDRLAFVTHQLNGISATVGYPQIGKLAAEVEQMVDDARKGHTPPDHLAPLAERIDALLDLMEDAVVDAL